MSQILIVDDSLFICKIIQQALKIQNIELSFAHSAKGALASVKKSIPDLILLDVVLPDMDGYKICSILKSDELTAEIPIIFITSRDSVDSVVKGFEAGAVDYINKPFNGLELNARVTAHLKNKQMTDQLMQALEENRKLAVEDPLTSLYNRRSMLTYLEQAAENDNTQTGVLLMGDVDNFKKINDTHGHNVGDYVLRVISNIFKETAGNNGMACRWGGEEFLMVLLGKTLAEGLDIGSNICHQTANSPYCHKGIELSCSITIGIAPLNFDKSIDANIHLCDQALYDGKASGKNRCVVREWISSEASLLHG